MPTSNPCNGNTGDCGDPSCAEVNRTGFSSSEAMAVLEKSPIGSALIKSLNPAPEFKYFEDLTPSQIAALRSSAETQFEADAASRIERHYDAVD